MDQPCKLRVLFTSGRRPDRVGAGERLGQGGGAVPGINDPGPACDIVASEIDHIVLVSLPD